MINKAYFTHGLNVYIIMFVYIYTTMEINTCAKSLSQLGGPSKAKNRKPQETDLISEMNNVLRQCNPMPLSALPQLNASEGYEQYLSFSRSLCSTQDRMRNCLSEEAQKWRAKHNGTLDNLFQVHRNRKETLMNILCENGGASYAYLIYGYKQRNEFSDNIGMTFNCHVHRELKAGLVEISNTSIESKIWYKYHDLVKFRECFISNIYVQDRFTSLAVEVINTVLNTMLCIHPQDQSIVLCKCIDIDFIDKTHMCLLSESSYFSSSSPKIHELEKMALTCFGNVTPQLLTPNSTMEVIDYFRKYCLLDQFQHCLSWMLLNAELCLDSNHLRLFKLILQNLQMVYDVVCLEDGRRLAHVFDNLTRIKMLIKTCLSMSLISREHSMDVYSYYQELFNLRDCLQRDVGENPTFHTAVDEITRAATAQMQCIHPQYDQVVLCKNIENN